MEDLPDEDEWGLNLSDLFDEEDWQDSWDESPEKIKTDTLWRYQEELERRSRWLARQRRVRRYS